LSGLLYVCPLGAARQSQRVSVLRTREIEKTRDIIGEGQRGSEDERGIMTGERGRRGNITAIEVGGGGLSEG
jgi:hypothetical protein